MKKLILSLLVVTAFVAAPVSLFAETLLSDDATGTAKASIVTTISLSNETSEGTSGDAAYLDFGSISTTGAGTVTITPANAVSTTGDVTLITSSRNPASFTVTGTPGADFSVSIADPDITLTSDAGSMEVTGLNASIDAGIVGASGETTFTVGGVLNVGGTQADGTYTGTFVVNVAYN